MNKQTKYLRKHGISVKTTKASCSGKSGDANAGYKVQHNKNDSLELKEFEIFRGTPCNTSFERKSAANKRQSAWRGAKPSNK